LLNGTRTVALPVSTVAPGVSSAEPQTLGIQELIDRGSTSFAGSIPEKQANIKLAAEKINGTVVPPGGTFSFNKEVGPTTLDAGFQWGFAIEGGASGPKTVPSVAGGICQVATTLFQPVFWAGYALEERYSHGYWIPAYTSRGVVGLDVTVDPDTDLDFKWTNPTDDYVLIQAGVQGESVWFSLYGRKPDWQVSVDPAAISNPRPADPTPVQQEEPSLSFGRNLQVESARDGFDVEVTRTVTPSAGDPRTLSLHTSYAPSHNVTLVGIGGRPS
jgi:vancomycin resistance protein YoaR